MKAKAIAALKARCVAAGVCWRCPKKCRAPVAPGKNLCAAHQEKENARSRARGGQRNNMVCVDCPVGKKQKAVRSWRCDFHADAQLAYRRRLRLKRARRFPFFGELLTVREVSEITGWAPLVLFDRITRHGMSLEQAAIPVRSTR